MPPLGGFVTMKLSTNESLAISLVGGLAQGFSYLLGL